VKDLTAQPVNFISKTPLDKIKLIVIYLGNTCNFDCVYCDRGYIESLGGQNLNKSTTADLKDFFEWVEKEPNELLRVSFHGGEPLLFIKRMEEVMQWLHPIAQRNNWKVTLTTNGSLVKECEWFFDRYKDVLYATISYDFTYQEKNREKFDVDEMAAVLNRTCAEWQWQCVLPIDDPKSFSFENISDIVNTCYRTNCRVVNIIPLRHKRGKDKFEVIIDRINLPQFLDAFLQFIQILYVKKLTVFIDGCYVDVDKAYFAEHNKLILSPDGYIYPEFDFLEYKTENARIGDWKNKQVWKNQGDEGRIYDSCLSCEKRPSCGLKYLYHLFDVSPGTKCKEFYTYMDYVIMHNAKLNQKKTVLEWIGIKSDFEINE
jgi:radical SAM protein with 4Fe4S-binding SPASM domain